MAEKVVVLQDREFRTKYWASDPYDPESEKVYPVENINALTPYGMLLAGLGSCTAIVLNTYAQHHGLDLKKVELTIEYHRIFRKDCEECEQTAEFNEQINEEILMMGNLNETQLEKLLKISHRCPIHQMLKTGIKIRSRLAAEKTARK